MGGVTSRTIEVLVDETVDFTLVCNCSVNLILGLLLVHGNKFLIVGPWHVEVVLCNRSCFDAGSQGRFSITSNGRIVA